MAGNPIIKVTRAVSGDSVSAVMPFVAPQGLGVQFNPAIPHTPTYMLANGTKGFLLEKPVLAAANYAPTILQDDVFMDNLVPPVKQGLEVSARQVEEAELEGDQSLIQVSGTGAISPGTPASASGALQPLGYINGLLALLQAGQETAGWLRAQLTPTDPSNTVRIRVQFAN